MAFPTSLKVFVVTLSLVGAMTGQRSQFLARFNLKDHNRTQSADAVHILQLENIMKDTDVDTAGPDKKAEKSLQAPSDKENPKCDQVCTDGTLKDRKACALACYKLQNQICIDGFSCNSACLNNHRLFEKDPECVNLCEGVSKKICYPLAFEADGDDVSPHHDDKPPPSIEATPAPRIFQGKTTICNVYPSSSKFEVLILSSPTDKDGEATTALSYKQCDEIVLKTGQFLGLRTRGVLAGVSKPIFKIPSIMLFGQFAHGNHQVNFNRYFVKSGGPFICNGFPIWEKDDVNKGAEVQLYREGYKGKELAKLRYKECTATSVHEGSHLAAEINGKNAGEYTILGEPRVIVLGKAGETTALAYEAWSTKEFGLFKK